MARKPSTAAATFTIPTMSTASGMRSVSPWRLLAGLLLLAAVACSVIAAATWQDVAFEGAYLNRSIGKPAYSGVSVTWGEPNEVQRILVGAAIGLAVSALLILANSIIQARRRAPRPPAPGAGRAP